MSILRIKDKDGNIYEVLAIRGEKGERGDRGIDAYAKAVEYGYKGTEAEFYRAMGQNGTPPDETLSISGASADAKATGNAIQGVRDHVDAVSEEIKNDVFLLGEGLSQAYSSMATTATYIVNVTNDWTADGKFYYQDIEVPTIRETDNPIPGVAYGEDNNLNVVYDECFGKVLHITTLHNKVRVWAEEAIDTAFPLVLKVVR